MFAHVPGMDTVDTLPMVEDVALPGPFVPSENAEDMVSALPQSATESGKVEVEVEVSNGEVQFLDPQGKNEVEVSNGEAQGHPKQSTEVEVNKDKTKSLETSHVNTEAKNEQLENLLQPGHASEPCGSSPSSEPPAPATLELDPQTSQPDKSPAKTPPNQTSHEGKVENSHVLPPGWGEAPYIYFPICPSGCRTRT